MLVCAEECVVIIVSTYGFMPVLGARVVRDPSRIAAEMISGSGFQGGGGFDHPAQQRRRVPTAACEDWPSTIRPDFISARYL